MVKTGLFWAIVRWAEKRGVRVETSQDVPPAEVTAYTINDYYTGGPYLTRVVFPRIFGVRPLLHHFHRPDMDRALHNHPWKWSLSIVLAGSYTEEREGKGMRRVKWFNWLTHNDFHRIEKLHGETWTLFLSGPRVQDWGFKIGGKLIPHAKYFEELKQKLR